VTTAMSAAIHVLARLRRFCPGRQSLVRPSARTRHGVAGPLRGRPFGRTLGAGAVSLTEHRRVGPVEWALLERSLGDGGVQTRGHRTGPYVSVDRAQRMCDPWYSSATCGCEIRVAPSTGRPREGVVMTQGRRAGPRKATPCGPDEESG
jgi:hypothetical protein